MIGGIENILKLLSYTLNLAYNPFEEMEAIHSKI